MPDLRQVPFIIDTVDRIPMYQALPILYFICWVKLFDMISIQLIDTNR
ncbi:hypothetical protein ADICEAN_00549 [Cesiribacter andamanensis AMV16]|uniref:Uncharacterized protein n=1 Tax=Cesiribacter andamanensis AMV16 TaxID=1279009 RepID=M7N6P9_9BACT|nr:hypothetical protein ADICEAN_00549 [Cesiribacter andamanensis AMV16]